MSQSVAVAVTKPYVTLGPPRTRGLSEERACARIPQNAGSAISKAPMTTSAGGARRRHDPPRLIQAPSSSGPPKTTP